MGFEKLGADQLSSFMPEYIATLRSLRPGEGVRASTLKEGATKITLKKRLQRAADVANVRIKFHRTPKDTVIVEVVGK